MLFCGIDTSNYTTSAALCDEGGKIIANIKIPLPVKSGERGLRQSDAVFAHIKNLPELTEKLKQSIGNGRLAAVAVSSKPRDAEDSYMPCFLSGVSAAGMLAVGAGVPIYHTSHQQGHIMAAYVTSGAEADNVIREYGSFIAFHVSGGTTECVLVSQADIGFSIELLGGTADLNAGQAIDRIGVALGLKFPCGPAMEALAKNYSGKIKGLKTSVNDSLCNLSGLENNALRMINNGVAKEEVCSYVFEFIAKTLKKLAENAREKHGNLPIVWAGGVMSNSIIKSRLAELSNVYFTEPQYSADNAAGVALICRNEYFRDHESQ
jgi:N6-L-threonylcarbamoyladenine synthase